MLLFSSSMSCHLPTCADAMTMQCALRSYSCHSTEFSLSSLLLVSSSDNHSSLQQKICLSVCLFCSCSSYCLLFNLTDKQLQLLPRLPNAPYSVMDESRANQLSHQPSTELSSSHIVLCLATEESIVKEEINLILL